MEERLSKKKPIAVAKRHIGSLFLDNAAYWVVKKIRRRAEKVGFIRHPIVVPVSDMIGQRVISTGGYERTPVDALDLLLSDPISSVGFDINWSGIFIDVGANIGVYTTRYAPMFDSTIAIEAHPVTFDILKANIALARSPRVYPFCFGASDSEGESQIHVAESGELGWSRLGTDATWKTFSIEIKTDTLDNLLHRAALGGRVALMKIDVEGYENQVIRGAKRILSEDGPVVLFEVLNGEVGRMSLSLLQEAGYDVFTTFSRPFTLFGLVTGLPTVVTPIDSTSVKRAALICAMKRH